MAKKVKYEVIKDFTDLQDKNKVYIAKDSFPNPANKKISDERIQELLSHDNKQGVPVIAVIKETE